MSYPKHRRKTIKWFAASRDVEFEKQGFHEDGLFCAMGSSTYEWLLNNSTGPWPYKVPCLVFTTRNLRTVEGANVRFVSGDIRSHNEDLKTLAQGKNIWLMGGGDLVAQFYDQGLLDEMIVQTVAVFLNEGKRF